MTETGNRHSERSGEISPLGVSIEQGPLVARLLGMTAEENPFHCAGLAFPFLACPSLLSSLLFS